MIESVYRQGDVLLLGAEMPEGAVEDPTPGPVVLQAGAATGHKHQLNRRFARLYQANGRRYLLVKAGTATLVHDEHDPIKLPKGVYEVRLPRQYTPEFNSIVED